MLLALDLIGVFVFALAGALAGVRKGLDLFGVLVLAVATALSGGVLRDLLIGAVPPAAFQDWRYVGAALLAGFVTFAWHGIIERLHNPVRVLDAAGLGLFAVAGAQRALEFGLSPMMSALLGMLTGIGGGVVRDLLLTRLPEVLVGEIYALAALAAAVTVVVGDWLNWPKEPTGIAAAMLCFGLRLLALHFKWYLPSARGFEPPRRE